MKMSVAEMIKKIQASRGLTNAELAEKSGVKKRTLENWFAKNGNPNPTLNELQKVAKALEVSLDTLVGNEQMSEPENFYDKYSRYKDLLARIDELDLKSAALINDIVEVFYRHTDKK